MTARLVPQGTTGVVAVDPPRLDCGPARPTVRLSAQGRLDLLLAYLRRRLEWHEREVAHADTAIHEALAEGDHDRVSSLSARATALGHAKKEIEAAIKVGEG